MRTLVQSANMNQHIPNGCANNTGSESHMPQFSKKETNVLLVIGVVAIVVGLAMRWIGAHFLATEVGIPEYLTALRNSGVTITCLAILWTVLAAFRKSQLL